MSESFWEMLSPIYGVETFKGYTEDDIAMLKEMFGALPQVLEDYYRAAGRTKAFHCGQDDWMLPEHFKKWEWLREAECMILLNENQGVCCAGIRREDLHLQDPPVYTARDDKNWVLAAPALSEFLPAALAYEAVFGFAYCPEAFYCLTKEEMGVVRANLTKLPFEISGWLDGMKITLYQNAPDNMAAVMDCCGDLQILYGAASPAGYEKLLEVLGGLGEEM